jgi:NAD(P)-dependent dehydrogenase (short-subunit alcohol dehydrogenase family)
VTGLLAGKVVVLSGVGPGLGRALGETCAAHGADVVLASRTERRLQRAAEVVRSYGRRALPVPTDVTEPAARQRLVDAALQEFGRVDVLVNNAFAIPPMEPLTTLAHESLRASNETNVLAPLALTAAFADALAVTQGSVVMVNSAVLHHSRVEFGGYKLAKGALLHLASSLATELGPRGIRVNTVAPGWIYENVQKAYFDHLAAERGVSHQDVYDEIAATTDLRRLPLPEEVAATVVFLASDLASAVTGQCLDVNCGEFHN